MNEFKYIQSPAVLDQILARTYELKFGMASETRTGALLRMLAASKPSGRILELGTGTGIATAWLLAGMDSTSTLLSVDSDRAAQAVASEALGPDQRLNLVTEDGAALLRKQDPESFDMVFADAFPGKYDALEEALAVVKPGGFYVIDDMLPQPNWPVGHAPRASALLRHLSTLKDFVIAPMAWASGLVVAARTGRE